MLQSFSVSSYCYTINIQSTMAKKKKKNTSGKVVRMSPKKYIRTKVRDLPVKECRVTDNWQEQGMATVLVAREMPSGNLTLASFLVDTFCLGVKDATYYHNLTNYEYDELIDRYNTVQYMQSCKYVEAHNLIYGAIAFAEDLGFEPHKDFSLAEYYLQEDDEQVELIEYEFGKEGRPVLILDASQNPARYISELDHSVGRGNYDVVLRDEWGEEQWGDEDGEAPVDDDDVSPLDTDRPFRFLLEQYEPEYEPEGGVENLQYLEMEIVYHEMETKYDEAYKDRREELQAAMEETYYMALDSEEAEEAVALLKGYLKEFPEYPTLYNFLYTALKNSSQKEEAAEVANQLYEKFPEYLHAKIGLATELLEQDKLDEAFKILDEKYNIMDLYPDTKAFHVSEVLAFDLFMVNYFLKKNDVDKAFLYYADMYDVSEDHPMTIRAEDLVGLAITSKKIKGLLESEKGKKPKD